MSASHRYKESPTIRSLILPGRYNVDCQSSALSSGPSTSKSNPCVGNQSDQSTTEIKDGFRLPDGHQLEKKLRESHCRLPCNGVELVNTGKVLGVARDVSRPLSSKFSLKTFNNYSVPNCRYFLYRDR